MHGETMRPQNTVPISKKTGTERAERLLLYHLLNDGELFDRIRMDKQTCSFGKTMWRYSFGSPGFMNNMEHLIFTGLQNHWKTENLRKIVLESAMVERDPEHAEEEIADCINHFEKYEVSLTIQAKIHESKEAEKINDHTRALELAREIIQLRKSLTTL